MWFVNGTKMDKEKGHTLELNVTKDHKDNNYTCKAMDQQLESYHSNPVQINPLCEAKSIQSNYWRFRSIRIHKKVLMYQNIMHF